MNRYHVNAFLFTFALAITLHISGQYFFKPVVYSIRGVLTTIISGIGISFTLPVIYITRNILRNDELLDQDKIIDKFEDNPSKFTGGKIKSYEVGKFALKDIKLYERVKGKVLGVLMFLFLYLIAIQVIEFTNIVHAPTIRGAFRNIISATGFGFVLLIMIEEAY